MMTLYERICAVLVTTIYSSGSGGIYAAFDEPVYSSFLLDTCSTDVSALNSRLSTTFRCPYGSSSGSLQSDSCAQDVITLNLAEGTNFYCCSRGTVHTNTCDDIVALNTDSQGSTFSNFRCAYGGILNSASCSEDVAALNLIAGSSFICDSTGVRSASTSCDRELAELNSKVQTGLFCAYRDGSERDPFNVYEQTDRVYLSYGLNSGYCINTNGSRTVGPGDGVLNHFIALKGCGSRYNAGTFSTAGCSCGSATFGFGCFSDQTTCNGFGNVDSNGTCTCDAGRSGADCSLDLTLASNDEEKQDFKTFYIVVGVLFGVLCCFCGQGGMVEDYPLVYMIAVGLRLFDLFTDWAFFAISIRNGSTFEQVYSGSYIAVWVVALISCVLGTLLFVPDIKEKRPTEDAAAGGIHIGLLVLLLEDAPQLTVNGIYLHTLGFNSADVVALFSFALSILSVLMNCVFLSRKSSESEKTSTGNIVRGPYGI